MEANAPPPKKIFSKSGGGVVDRCSIPPSKIQGGGGLRPPQPPLPVWRPCYHTTITLS